jgi:hypothetical protein
VLPSADGAVLGPPAVATVTISDNDIGPHWVMPDPWSGGYWVAEDEGHVVLVVHRGQDVELPAFTIDYATQDDTAVSGEDYIGSSGTLHFAEGQGEQVLLIPILADDVAEKTETFQATMSNPPAGMPFNARQAVVTVKILDATGHSGHVLESITASPGAGCTLMLTSRLPAEFDDYFDPFCLDVSSDLRHWSSLGWVAKRNRQPEPVSCFDPEIAAHRFYRLSKANCIVPVPPPTGPYRVELTERVVSDETRRNRYSRSANSSLRIWGELLPCTKGRPPTGQEWLTIEDNDPYPARPGR